LFQANVSQGEGIVFSYTWEFGDGSESATGQDVSHTFNDAGSYTVTSTATDISSKETYSASAVVTVTVPVDPDPEPVSGPGVAIIVAGGGEAFTLSETMIVSDPDIFGDQQPWIDDNFDGIFSSTDGPRANRVIIGIEGVAAAEPPSIVQVHDPIDLPVNSASADLWVKTFPLHGGINKVVATLKKPGFEQIDYEGLETDFGAIELIMIYNPAKERYEAVYDAFREAGMWKVVYQAQGEEGEWSEVADGVVNAKGMGDATIFVNLNLPVY